MIQVIVIVVLLLLLIGWWYPHIRINWHFWKKYKGTTRKLPPFVPFPLPFFGHSLQLRPSQEPFVLRNHKRFGPVFGFYMQDRPFFCLDIAKYEKEVNASPSVVISELPPTISPYKAFPTSSLPPILRGTYAEHLKQRLPFVQKQLESFLRAEFPDSTTSYVRDEQIFHRLTACYTLASWFDLDYSQMQKLGAIEKLVEYARSENSWRDVTLVMPRLAFYARFCLKKFAKMVESFVDPVVQQRKVEPEKEKKSLLDIIRNNLTEGANFDSEILDCMIIFLPGAMSISPSVKHLFSLLLIDDFLAKVESEQAEILESEGVGETVSLSKMKYLDAALKETLRLEFTLASFRYITEDIVLHDGFVLPAGSHFILTGSAINYNESLFPNSHVWSPQRWVDLGDQKNLKFSERREAFIWGSGKVICPGRTHAMLGMKLMTSLLFRSFTCRIGDKPGKIIIKART